MTTIFMITFILCVPALVGLLALADYQIDCQEAKANNWDKPKFWATVKQTFVEFF